MGQLALFSGTLGLSPPWQVTSVTFAKETNRLDINVEYRQLTPLVCPHCGAEGARCTEEEDEIWFHADFFHYATYLHARVPRLSCCYAALPRPWCRLGSLFAQVPPPEPAQENRVTEPTGHPCPSLSSKV